MYEGGRPKNNWNCWIVGVAVVVPVSATRCMLPGPYCVSLLDGIGEWGCVDAWGIFSQTPTVSLSVFCSGPFEETTFVYEVLFYVRETSSGDVVLLKTAEKKLLCGKQVYEWSFHFKNSEMSIEDLPCFGEPSTSKMEENIVCELIVAEQLVNFVTWLECPGVPDNAF